MPLGVCLDGELFKLVPAGSDGRAELAAVAAKHGRSADEFEILVVCHRHPTSSAVDCLDCEPVDEPTTANRPYPTEGMGRAGGADLAEVRCVDDVHIGCDHDPDRISPDYAPNSPAVDRG